MVLLTYQTGDVVQEAALIDKESPLKSGCPKTPYIDKICAFNEAYADEERCDLFFICNDGEIPAHRLVISNASKYIMSMQDELPPWYPVYISVPDLSVEMVKTLVRLAYTGQMSMPPGTSSDELLDAMQALGWVNTDCLTATYLDSSAANTDDDGAPGPLVTTTSTESLEAVLKMNFPAQVKGDDTSDDEGMEMNVPDVPLSDDDEGRLEIVTEPNSPKRKKGAAGKTKAKETKKATSTPPKPTKLNSRRRQSPKVESKTAEASPPTGRRNPRKNADEKPIAVTPSKAEPKQKTESEADASIADVEPSEPLRSRTRTIKKPKKFEDSIVLTPSKRKDSSPTKSPSKPAPKPKANDIKSISEPKTSKRPATNSKSQKPETNSVVPAAKNRRSTSTDTKSSGKNPLITSYFNKRTPRTSNDAGSSEDVPLQENNVIEPEVEDTVSKEVSDDKPNAPTENGNGSSPTASLRTRAKSNASSKGETETAQDDSTHTTKSRRKRSNQGELEEETEDTEANPQKRGRKASTISNASKSSAKELPVANDVEEKSESGDGPRTRRNRQD